MRIRMKERDMDDEDDGCTTQTGEDDNNKRL